MKRPEARLVAGIRRAVDGGHQELAGRHRGRGDCGETECRDVIGSREQCRGGGGRDDDED